MNYYVLLWANVLFILIDLSKWGAVAPPNVRGGRTHKNHACARNAVFTKALVTTTSGLCTLRADGCVNSIVLANT